MPLTLLSAPPPYPEFKKLSTPLKMIKNWTNQSPISLELALSDIRAWAVLLLR